MLIFGVAAGVLFVTGLSPELFPGRGLDTALLELNVLVNQAGIAGWAGWTLPVVAGIALFLFGEGWRQRLEGGWQGLGALLRLEWIYGFVFVALRGVVDVVRGASRVVEGEGALLWTAMILLIILLYVTGNGAMSGG